MSKNWTIQRVCRPSETTLISKGNGIKNIIGSWDQDPFPFYEVIVADGDEGLYGGTRVCRIDIADTYLGEWVAESNVRLIAAAPQMRKVLLAVIHKFSPSSKEFQMIDLALKLANERNSKYNIGQIVYYLTDIGFYECSVASVQMWPDGNKYDIVGDGCGFNGVPESFLTDSLEDVLKKYHKNKRKT